MRYLLTVAVVFTAATPVAITPAAAQTTQCAQTIPGMPSVGVTCQTTGGAASTYRWQDVPPTACTKFERLANSSNTYCEARTIAASRKAVGDLIAEGKCGDALKAALGTGDLGFAREVREFCSTEPKPEAAPAPAPAP